MAALNFCSLDFYYGGKFILVPKSIYTGGSVERFEDIEMQQFHMSFLNTMADKFMIRKCRRFFVLLRKGFMLIVDDKALQNYVKKHVNTSKHASIYVEGEIDYAVLTNVDTESLIETEVVVQSGVQGKVSRGGVAANGDDDDDSSEGELDCNSDEDFLSECNSDLDCDKPADKIVRGKKYVHSENYDPQFEVDMTFATRDVLRKAIHAHAIRTMRNIKLEHCEELRVTAKCKMVGCPWHIHARKFPNEHTYKIVHYNPEHECCSTVQVSNLKPSCLVERYLSNFKTDPNRKLEAWRKDVMKEIGVNVSWDQAYRTRKAALAILDGDPSEQYTLLGKYKEELLRSNPGSTVVVQADDTTSENIFWSFYVCFGGLKEGFAAGCRKIIGLDGAHLSGPYGGVLLTAVGHDPNNKPYPLAYAVVGTESAMTWEWFLGILKMDLNIVPSEFTFISDKQKGLIKACGEVFFCGKPGGADHRFCIRHMWKNMVSAGFKGEAYKNALFKASNATSVDTYSIAMKELSELDPKAVEWLADKPPSQWSKSHFSIKSCSDLTLNNNCESFNKTLVPARLKPILVMSEWIREYIMQRLQKSRDKACFKWKGPLCPKAKKILEHNMGLVKYCRTLKVNDFHFQVSVNQFQYNVNFQDYTCSCRRWQLVGIPCSHALSAIGYLRLAPTDFVHAYYSVETYKKVYAPAIFGINGRGLWPDSDYIPPLPPNFGRKGKAGRPQHKRRREEDEHQNKAKNASKTGPKQQIRSRRIQTHVKCSFCNLVGHNTKGCQVRKAQEIEKQKQADLNISQEFADAFSNVIRDEFEPEETSPFDYTETTHGLDDPYEAFSHVMQSESDPNISQVGDLTIDSVSIIEPSRSLNVFRENMTVNGSRSKLQVVKNTAKKGTPSMPSQSSTLIKAPSSWEQVSQHRAEVYKKQTGPGVILGEKTYVQVKDLSEVLKKKQKKS